MMFLMCVDDASEAPNNTPANGSLLFLFSIVLFSLLGSYCSKSQIEILCVSKSSDYRSSYRIMKHLICHPCSPRKLLENPFFVSVSCVFWFIFTARWRRPPFETRTKKKIRQTRNVITKLDSFCRWWRHLLDIFVYICRILCSLKVQKIILGIFFSLNKINIF